MLTLPSPIQIIMCTVGICALPACAAIRRAEESKNAQKKQHSLIKKQYVMYRVVYYSSMYVAIDFRSKINIHVKIYWVGPAQLHR